MNKCIFCLNTEQDNLTFSSKEHIIPESLGNEKYILSIGFVCDECNNYFPHLENDFLSKYIGRIARVFSNSKTKKGKYPQIQSDSANAQRIDDNTFTFKWDGTGRVGEIFEFEPASSKNVSMVLSKIDLEMICYKNKNKAYSPIYDDLRRYSRSIENNLTFVPFVYAKTSDFKTINLKLRKY